MDTIIEEEIKRNGNTCLISDSGFESGQQIFAIGDSHSIFFHNSMKVKVHWFGVSSYLPVTIFKFISEKIDILNIGNNIGDGHELYNVKSNDFVVMFFGFNDIQKNIFLHAKDRWKEEIKQLIDKYIETVLILKQVYSIIPIISSIYPNPRPNAQGQNSMGSFEERKQYTLYANSLLLSICLNKSILFFDNYEFISDEDGFIKESFTSDNIHLDYNNKFLREFVDSKIIDLCKK